MHLTKRHPHPHPHPPYPDGYSVAVMDQQHYTVTHHTLRPVGLSDTRRVWLNMKGVIVLHSMYAN